MLRFGISSQTYGQRALLQRPLRVLAGLLFTVLVSVSTGCRMANAAPFDSRPLTFATEAYRDRVLLLGRSPEYPLPMASITASYEWLDRLTDLLGGPIRYERVRSLRSPTAPETLREPPHGLRGLLESLRGPRTPQAHIIDCYRLTDSYGNERLIYLDPYAGHTAAEAPEGMRLRAAAR